ncbi:hypothetical protein ElyMa_004034000 [Elysia marginata]|uniref:Uncharacterized protein n=1 Tax=Elysia marginata TaxID=1093978 RepID=A0AAV4G4P5_9GAST|nr:hypothetical protein ElyMa_004034000 [Elysia marginata]
MRYWSVQENEAHRGGIPRWLMGSRGLLANYSVCAMGPLRRTKPNGEEIQDGYVKIDALKARQSIVCYNTPLSIVVGASYVIVVEAQGL